MRILKALAAALSAVLLLAVPALALEAEDPAVPPAEECETTAEEAPAVEQPEAAEAAPALADPAEDPSEGESEEDPCAEDEAPAESDPVADLLALLGM